MSKYPEVFDQFNRPEAAGIDNKEPTRTKAEFAEEADINRLMERYTFTGVMPEGMVGTYGDFSEAPDFMQAQEIVLRAQAQFAALPHQVRSRFENDPAQFLQAVHDGSLEPEEMADLGLLNEEAVARVRKALADQRDAEVEAEVAKRTAASAARSAGVPGAGQ